MSAVFRTLTLTWDGKTYEVKPTMELLNRIENRVSLLSLVRGLSTDTPPISHISFVLGEFLRQAGARVDDVDVYHKIMTGDSNAMSNLGGVFAAVFPDPKKKGETQPDQ